MQCVCPGCTGAAPTPSPGSASQQSHTRSPPPPRFNTPPFHPWLVCTAQNVLGIISVCTFASVCAACISKAIKSSSVCLRGTCIFPPAGLYFSPRPRAPHGSCRASPRGSSVTLLGGLKPAAPWGPAPCGSWPPALACPRQSCLAPAQPGGLRRCPLTAAGTEVPPPVPGGVPPSVTTPPGDTSLVVTPACCPVRGVKH